MSGYTRFGSAIWSWEPWISLGTIDRDTRRGRDAQHLWLALYTSGEAKRTVPGLFHGSVHVMADAAHMQPDDTWYALHLLQERDMVEFDQTQRVLRLCAPEPFSPLPDPGEFPFNGNTIKGWWNRFKTVPQCPARDAHVPTLRWIMEAGALETEAGELSQSHLSAWDQTFGRLRAPGKTLGGSNPPKKRRGARQLGEADTGTHAQPSLFGPAERLKLPPGGSGGSETDEMVPCTVPDPLLPVSTPVSPVPPTLKLSESGSDSVLPISGTWEPFRERFREGYRNQQDQDQDQEQDQEPDLILSSADQRTPSAVHGPGVGSVVPAVAVPVTTDGPTRPALVLVPLPLPFSAQEMLDAIGKYGPHVLERSEGLQEALHRTIPVLDVRGVGPPDLALAGRWIATACPRDSCCGAPCEADERGRPRGIPPPEWWCHPDNVQRAIAHARVCEDEAREITEAVAEARRKLGYA